MDGSQSLNFTTPAALLNKWCTHLHSQSLCLSAWIETGHRLKPAFVMITVTQQTNSTCGRGPCLRRKRVCLCVSAPFLRPIILFITDTSDLIAHWKSYVRKERRKHGHKVIFNSLPWMTWWWKPAPTKTPDNMLIRVSCWHFHYSSFNSLVHWWMNSLFHLQIRVWYNDESAVGLEKQDEWESTLAQVLRDLVLIGLSLLEQVKTQADRRQGSKSLRLLCVVYTTLYLN